MSVSTRQNASAFFLSQPALSTAPGFLRIHAARRALRRMILVRRQVRAAQDTRYSLPSVQQTLRSHDADGKAAVVWWCGGAAAGRRVAVVVVVVVVRRRRRRRRRRKASEERDFL